MTLRPVALAEYDDYFAHLEEYQRELDQYDTEAGDDPWDPAQHREAVLDEIGRASCRERV